MSGHARLCCCLNEANYGFRALWLPCGTGPDAGTSPRPSSDYAWQPKAAGKGRVSRAQCQGGHTQSPAWLALGKCCPCPWHSPVVGRTDGLAKQVCERQGNGELVLFITKLSAIREASRGRLDLP